MNLSSLLDFKDREVISIVGAGGKTTLMFRLASELRRMNKLLVSTTTKIYVPREEEYDFITVGQKGLEEFTSKKEKGIYVYGDLINNEGKLVCLSSENLLGISDNFDITLYEADGSKGKPIKGWNANEPVIEKGTTKTIGVLSIESLGLEINEINIHRIDEFLRLTGEKIGNNISVETLVSVICSSQGLFKNSCGEKILFINKIETKEQKDWALCLIDHINEKNHGIINKIIYGSLKNREYVQF